MGSIQSRQLAVGYQAAGRRPACRNCKHGAEATEERAFNLGWQRWECRRYGFRVTAAAICDRHEPKGQKGSAA